jgi:hypothetical protein
MKLLWNMSVHFIDFTCSVEWHCDPAELQEERVVHLSLHVWVVACKDWRRRRRRRAVLVRICGLLVNIRTKVSSYEAKVITSEFYSVSLAYHPYPYQFHVFIKTGLNSVHNLFSPPLPPKKKYIWVMYVRVNYTVVDYLDFI